VRKLSVALAAASAAVVLAAGAGSAFLLDDKAPSRPVPSPSPATVRTSLLQPLGAAAAMPTSAGLTRALAQALRDPGLGGQVSLSVVDAMTGDPLLSRGADRTVVPASTAKIATAVAALRVLDPTARLTTRVVRGAPGDVVLVGGGDPTLGASRAKPGYPSPARLVDLARQLAGLSVRRVVVDDSLFTGPRLGPGWKPGYVTSGNVAPVSALEVDGGRMPGKRVLGRAADPALEAGRQLAALLRVKVVVRGKAPAGAVELAHVDSPPVADLVEQMLSRSDNDLAEALGRQVALAKGLPASFAGEARAIDAGLHDASGLSVLDRIAPRALTALLVAVATEPGLAPVLSGLPVAGFDGTLADRYRKGPAVRAAGEVRAKTGTLDGVSALAGLVRTRDGRLLAFALAANRVPITGTVAAQTALDRLAAVLASCGCR
jgi:D-alanyl-D-alanine carboxypeptidase/D-alanyl-D-alanine-endopeptidase (penicillin-binding protein 4)